MPQLFSNKKRKTTMRFIEIDLSGELLAVSRNDNNSLTVFKSGEQLGEVWLSRTNFGFIWHSNDFSDFYTARIGKLIEKCGALSE